MSDVTSKNDKEKMALFDIIERIGIILRGKQMVFFIETNMDQSVESDIRGSVFFSRSTFLSGNVLMTS